MSIGLSFSKPIIFLKIFNYEIKSNPSIYNKLLCFKDFSKFKHLKKMKYLHIVIHKTFVLFLHNSLLLCN